MSFDPYSTNLKQNRSDKESLAKALKLSYLKFTWTRCFRRLGKLLCGLILLGAVCAGAIYGFSFVKGDDTAAASRFQVVFVMPQNAGLHYKLALGMVSNMESLSSMVTVKQTTSEEEARSMLENGEASAAVIIPEGMIHTVMTGTNDLPARILYPGDPSLETLIFRQIVDSLAQMVASAQTGVYALYEIYADFDASEKQQDKANSQLNDLYINTVLDRTSLFSVLAVSSDENAADTDTSGTDNTIGTNSTILTGYLCSGLALLFLLSGINLCFFFLAPNKSVPTALVRLGLSDSFCHLADFSAALFCQWLIFSSVTLLLGAFGVAAGILSSFSFAPVFLCCLLCAAFSCAMQLFICRICRSKLTCMLTTFVVSLLLLYCSGCLIPSAFLPDVLRRISSFLPGSQLKNCLFALFGQPWPFSDAAGLLIESLILVLCALVHTHGKNTVSSPFRRERRNA